ncbi:MAG TPA: hypothetical protein VKH45_15055 [Candidatus Acidoferrum sp.]|nr:hypothetical protein [Candidatus Acidoferrum sp.]
MAAAKFSERLFLGVCKRVIRAALLPVCRIQVVYFATLPSAPAYIVASNRLYDPRNWIHFRRVRVWIGFGEQIVPRPDLARKQARELVQKSLSNAFVSIKDQMVATFRLDQADLPATPQARKREDYLPEPRR